MKHFVFLSMILGSLCGCAGIGSRSDEGLLAQVDNLVTGAPQTLVAVAEVSGEPALLYVALDKTTENRVVFQYRDQRRFIDETARVRGGNRFQLHVMDKKLLALWWSHEDKKNLYAALSENQGKDFAPVSMVNDEHGVLPPPSLLRGPQGVLGISYLDERLPGYQMYFNRSEDGGRTWARHDQRLDSPPTDGLPSRVQEPQSVESGSVWFSAWADTERVDGNVGYRIMGRRSEDAGRHWSEPEVIYRPQKFISSLTVRAHGNNIVLAADERARGIVAIASTDQGRSWRASELLEGTGYPPNADGASNSGIEMALVGERAYLVWMQDRGGEKVKLMRGSLDVSQAKWLSTAQRLDIKAHDNTRSTTPTILASPQGVIWTAWTDYRDIRPNIYVSTSSDQGNTWSTPEPFLKPGEMSAGFPRLLPWGNGLALAYEIYPTELAANGKFMLRTIALDDGGRLKRAYSVLPSVGDAEKKSRLQQRIQALWNYRIAGDYSSAYDFFDFAYKAATPKKNYLDNVGTITFHSYSIENIAVNGNEAAVKMKLNYEVKQSTLPSGKPLKLAPIDVEAEYTWVWVDGDWYFVFAPVTGRPNLRY